MKLLIAEAVQGKGLDREEMTEAMELIRAGRPAGSLMI